MVRLFILLLVILLLTGGMFLALVFGLDHFGWVQIFDARGRLIPASGLELIRFLPGLLAFAASLVAASVAFRWVTLQEAANQQLGKFTADLSDQVETLRMQIGLSQRDAERMSPHLTHALKSAAAYLALLQQLDNGIFNAAEVRAAERQAKQSAAVLDPGSAAQGAYDEFLQTGTDMSTRAKGVVAWWRWKQIWKDDGAELSDRFIELQTRIEVARAALGHEAMREAAPPLASE